MSEPVVGALHEAPMDDDLVIPIVVYALYLLPGLNILALIIAWWKKRGAGDVARSHYVFQIRTAWIAIAWFLLGGVIALIGVILLVVLIGFALFPVAWAIWGLTVVWFYIRSIVGLLYALRGQAYPQPRTLLI